MSQTEDYAFEDDTLPDVAAFFRRAAQAMDLVAQGWRAPGTAPPDPSTSTAADPVTAAIRAGLARAQQKERDHGDEDAG